MKKIIIIISCLLAIAGVMFSFYARNKKAQFDALVPVIKLNGSNSVDVVLNGEFKDAGAVAKFNNGDISKDIKVFGEVDTTKLGKYTITYEIQANNKTVSITRDVNVVDKDLPVITLEGDLEQTFYIGTEFAEDGYSASDNVDGDLTDKVVVENNLDMNTPGEYKIIYKVSDSSGNEDVKERTIIYLPFKTLPSEGATATNIAVLNYHFFYENGSMGGNFMRADYFEEELKFLKENNYKTLTMEEFRAWMYGEIELPARSVLLTIDDGAQGTGIHNGNVLIPLLEKYQAHATLFLISGWWSPDNYRSEYLDIESHSYNMHTSNYCDGVSRGAQMLCYDDEKVRKDLQKSIDSIGSNTAFCFPFYAYSDHAIELVKEAGFKLGFIGGDRKTNRNTDKYKIPRYHMYDFTPLGNFVSMIA